MTPEQLAKNGSEHGHQCALFAWVNIASRYGVEAANDDRCYAKGGQDYAQGTYGAAHALPVLNELYAIPNGGQRHGAVAAKLKAEGVKAGTPDLHLPVARGWFHSLYIEMKRAGGKVSPEQLDRIARLRANGNKCHVCFSWLDAVVLILEYIDTK
jgi:hypothetical protein